MGIVGPDYREYIVIKGIIGIIGIGVYEAWRASGFLGV